LSVVVFFSCLVVLELSEIEDAFITHVEQEVEDRKVGQEAMLLLIHLIIRLGLEIRIRQRVLGADRLAKVDFRGRRKEEGGRSILRGQGDFGLDVDQFAHFSPNGLVEIEQIVPTLFEERTDVVLIIFKEGRLAVGTLQGVPMQMPPVAVVADARILDER